ncbi:MAG TPA: UvrD-helicase domain-containing protein, partial [Opitutaceae bacterium]|nr:UvrD-helicase domain-containing protein [Opitutaceae bacterium]
MNTVGHEMIFASAGSGKTFALTTRFIRLLALGVAPERIVALTFTRKAAGEFFGEIVNRLAAAGEDEDAARTLAKALERPELAAADFRRLLRGMVGAMHRLNLGTLDGFFAKIVRAFPLELGLGGEPGLLDEHAAAEERRRVLARLFAGSEALTPEQKALVEAFRLATFGTEGKSVAASLDRFVEAHLALYRAAPQAAKWGVARRIWAQGFPWAVADDAAVARAADEIDTWAARSPELKDKPRARWRAFAREALAWTPGQPRPENLEFVLKKALAEWPAVAAGAATLTIDRQKCALGAEVCGPLAVLARRIVGLELGRRMAVTQGIAAVLKLFDRLYDAEVRRAGRLTFADLQQLLSPDRAAADAGLETRATAEQGAAGGWGGEALDYRIDARLDHWLFDEFQDTSYQQWRILEKFVDEVVQDPEGRRSLFYVGDVKQAIYTWREGDPRLFRHVAARYRGAIAEGELNDSWRSGPALIEMVNRVCGDGAAIAELFPEAAAEWNGHWREHRSARPERSGQAALLLADDEAGRWETTLRLLQELRPTERGLTCAVLVRRNEIGAQLADYLRREGGIAAVAEADLKIGTDNPAATALAALLQLAVHPDDGFARRQVAMSPLAALLGFEGHGSGDPCHGAAVRGAIEAEGFELWLAGWARRLEPVLAADDAFTRLRLRQLVAAGRIFDERGTRDVDAFRRFLDEYSVREPEGAGVVRVMTVHKAKGLGFDVVILPDLEGQKLAQRRDGPAVCKAADRSVAWVLNYPESWLADADPVLREYAAAAVAENCYEQLSLLYVALTRAKRALYAVIEPPGKSASLNFPRLLTATLGAEERTVRVGEAGFRGVWATGEVEWMMEDGRRTLADGRGATDKGRAQADAAEPEVAPGLDCGGSAAGAAANMARPDPVGAVRLARRAPLVALRPSGLKPGRVQAGRLLAGGGAAATEFGVQVHRLFATVEWFGGPDTAERWVADARGEGRPEAAVREVATCLQTPELRTVFARENPGDEVWRERAFEAVVAGAWVSGALDRVVVRRTAEGGRTVAIYDFKTERGADEAGLRERHAAQLNLYRAVVAKLAGVEEGTIRAFVVATETGRL